MSEDGGEGQELPRILDGGRAKLLAALVGIGTGQAVAAVATALIVEFAFDRFILSAGGPPGAPGLGELALGLLIAAGAGAALRFLERTTAERLGQSYTHAARVVLTRRLTSLSARDLQRRSRGGVVLRFVGDLTALRTWVSLGLARLVVAGATTGGALAALFLISPAIAGGVLVTIVIGAIAAIRLGRTVRDTAREARRRRTHLAANVTEKAGAVGVVQAFGQVDRERRRIARQSRRLAGAMVDRARAAGRLAAVTEGTASGATGVALLLGIGEVAAGRGSAGSVVAAMTIVGLLVSPLRDLGRVEEYRQNAHVSRDKLRSFLSSGVAMDDAPTAPELAPGPGALEFDGVQLEGILEPFTATAEPGSLVAVVGGNGAGKSTLLMLAARLIPQDAGVIRLDGQDLSQHDPGSVRRAIGIVASDLPLLRGTIESNLRYRWREAPPEELARVSALCGIDELVAALPLGLATRIREGGAGLSLGQRQRVCLARALLGGPRVLLLDEPDANLDPESDGIVTRVVEGFVGTVLFVTHRHAWMERADVVWHLEDGQLVAAGRPGDVMAARSESADAFDSAA